jgi:hypothetical protein
MVFGQQVDPPALYCLCYKALIEWHFGEIAACQSTIAEAISLAKELNDTPALAFALYFGGILARFERNPAEVERLASELIELSTRYNFAFWLPGTFSAAGRAARPVTRPRAFCGSNTE